MTGTTEAVYRIGTHRIVTPEETLSRISGFASRMGITRIADVTGLDSVNIPVVMVCRPNARSVSVSQGKGSTVAAAKASGLMESVEGFHAEHLQLPVRLCTWFELMSSEPVVSVDELPTLADSRFGHRAQLPWVLADDLMGGGRAFVPLEMVHTNYTLPRVTGSGCFPASSNGLASGNSIQEASVHGLCEVIERDAVSLWHMKRRKTLQHTGLDLESVDDPLSVETLAKLDAAGLDTFVWDIISDTGIPTYLCVLFDRRQEQGHIGLGSGTHLSREVALLRALHEAVQVRTTYIVGARDDITLGEYTPEVMAEKRAFFLNKVKQCAFSRRFSDTADRASGFVDKDLETLLNALAKVGIKQVMRVDLSRAEFNIPVVRMVVPGIESPHDDEGYVPGTRAQAAREPLT